MLRKFATFANLRQCSSTLQFAEFKVRSAQDGFGRVGGSNRMNAQTESTNAPTVIPCAPAVLPACPENGGEAQRKKRQPVNSD